MTKQLIAEILPKIMEILESFGYEKHTLWGNMYGSFSGLVNFYKRKGILYYDPQVTSEYIALIESRYQKKDLSRESYSTAKRVARRFDEYYLTGTLNWNCNKRNSKFKLNPEYERLVEMFLSSRSFHNNTKWDFAWAVKKHLAYYQEHGIERIQDATVSDARSFVVKSASSLSSGSLHNLLCYLKQFYEFLIEKDMKAPDCIAILSYHVPRKMPIHGYVTDEELSAILQTVDTTTSLGKRDIAIIQLGATTGLRAIDIVHLKLSDINWRQGELNITQCKTGSILHLPLLQDAGEALKEYILNGRPESSSPEIFLREKAPFISMSSGVAIGYLFDKYCKRAEIDRKPYDGKGFHGLRRRLARNMLTSGTPVTTIAQVLGHQNMETVKQYLSLDSQSLKECALDFTGIVPERSSS
ncbi:MAG: site-specific integrase [Lachnospiraceae bacterium]|nr:site-specific integrase [Lachnospiraceae bacterium]